MCRYGNASAELVCCSEGFDHEGGHAAPFTPVAMLQLRHRPRKISHRHHLDLVGQCGDLRAKSVLDISRQSGNRRRELAGHLGISQGRAEPKQPQPGGGNAIGRKTT